MNILYQIAPNLETRGEELLECTVQTIQMVAVSALFAFVIGVILGVLLIVTKKGGLMECTPLYRVLDKGIDIVRSIPFIILMFLLIPVSRAIVGTSLGVAGAYVPLICGTVPFFGRQVETAIAEVDSGLIEASESMGFTPVEIIFGVYLRESIPSITRVSMITLVNLVGLTAMAGAVGAGGLGDFAIRYGYQQYEYDLLWITVIIILLIVSVIQLVGNIIIRKTSH